VPSDEDNEIGALCEAFNNMAERLEASYEVLEKRVAERTQALSLANRELERSNQELEQFAYVASHDIQEPLRAITGFAKLLRDQGRDQLGAQSQEYLRYIIDGAERLKLLIDNLLEYSHVRSQKTELQTVSAQVAFQQAVENLRGSIQQRQATVTSSGLGDVLADPQQLTQLFQNLISNGIKFCDQPSPQVHVHADYGPQWVTFSVRDNGIGLERRDFQRIFTIFQRLHAREAYEGTGIGLAICQQIVQRHGGQIWVESEPGEGSTFFFTLPLPSGGA
jgi:light-regulated signal transduction histidine kinase (bacteriophytochrome)